MAIDGFDGHRGSVWVARAGRLERADATFGARDDRGRAEVTGGLPEGAQVILRLPKGAAAGRALRIEAAP